jgi:ribosome-binding protein aMBF1 (putative translation factor)
MPQPENPTVAKLEAIADPVARAAAAQEFLTNGRTTIRLVEQLRDRAIRQARSGGGITIDQLAARIHAGRHIVVDACRGQKEQATS